jgi:hypothetical protein
MRGILTRSPGLSRKSADQYLFAGLGCSEMFVRHQGKQVTAV